MRWKSLIGLAFTLFAASARADLVAGGQRAIALPPGGARTVRFEVCAGCFADLRVAESAGMVFASVTPATKSTAPLLQRSEDAGPGAIIRIPLIAGRGGTYHLQLQSRDSRLPVRIRVRLTINRHVTAADRVAVRSETWYAQAERLRRSSQTSERQMALRLFDRVIALARRLPDRTLERRALIGKARVLLFGLGDYPAGLVAAQAAVSLRAARGARAADDTAFEALAWKTLSSADAFLARYSDSIAAGERALRLYASLGDRYWQGILQSNLAYVFLEVGETGSALSAAEASLAIARALEDGQGIAFSLGAIAAIHQSRGEYRAAIDADERALTQLRLTPYPDEEGLAWANLASLYGELGDFADERRAQGRALPIFHAVGDDAGESTAYYQRAMLDIDEQRLAPARADIRHALAIAARRHLSREQANALLAEARERLAAAQPAQALVIARRGLALAGAARQRATQARLRQLAGDIEAASGRTAVAVADYRLAQREWMLIPNAEHAAVAQASVARLEWHAGRARRAYHDILQALEDFETSRGEIGGRLLRESFFASHHAYYDLAVRIAMALRGKNRGVGYARAAWRLAERAKARSLLDAIRRQRSFSTRNVPATLLNHSAALEREIAATERAIASAPRSADAQQEASLLEQERRLHWLRTEAAQLRADERELATHGALFTTGVERPSLARVQRQLLSRGTALLEYWVGPRSVYRWLITRDRVVTRRIGSRQWLAAATRTFDGALLARELHPLNEDFSTYHARIAAADADARREGRDLGRRLLPQALPPSVRRLIIVPDGSLYSLPFAAVRRRGAYLVRHFTLIEEPSATVAVDLLAAHRNLRGRDRIVVFGDPIVSGKEPRLANASVEAHAIAALAGANRSELFLGINATPRHVEHLHAHQLLALHFATHAFVNRQRRGLSGIVLSDRGRKGHPHEGVLWEHDIIEMHLAVPIVTLGACDTAAGSAIPGEGIASLGDAFLYGGAWSVIDSLWDVDDAASNVLFPTLYAHILSGGWNPPLALRAAQLAMLADPARAAPYYWAGFSFDGDWRATVGRAAQRR